MLIKVGLNQWLSPECWMLRLIGNASTIAAANDCQQRARNIDQRKAVPGTVTGGDIFNGKRSFVVK